MRTLSRAVLVVLATATLSSCATEPVERSMSAALVGGSAGFRPASVRVQQGEKVDLTVNNRTTAPHGFTIQDHNVSRTVDPDKPIHVRFTARQVGRFRIFCQLHPAHQPATLVVR